MFYNLIFAVTLLICVFSKASVFAAGFGKCPNYPSMPKFNMTQFLGTWYEVERSFYLPEILTGCTTMTFRELNTEEDRARNITEYLKIEISVKNINLWTGSPSISLGYATRDDSKTSIVNFMFQSRLPESIARFLPGNGKYQILYSDFKNFAILYSCTNFGFAYADQIWLLGRERDFDVEVRKRVYDILTQLGLGSDRLTISKNKNCPVSL